MDTAVWAPRRHMGARDGIHGKCVLKNGFQGWHWRPLVAHGRLSLLELWGIPVLPRPVCAATKMTRLLQSALELIHGRGNEGAAPCTLAGLHLRTCRRRWQLGPLRRPMAGRERQRNLLQERGSRVRTRHICLCAV